MDQLPYWDATLIYARLDAINHAKPNPNICLGCVIRGLENVIYSLNPL